MPLVPLLSVRRRQPELMDHPDLNSKDHHHALQGLRRLNFWSGSLRILWRPIRDLIHEQRLASARILDIASGGGDLAIGLWLKARRHGLTLDIQGCDISSQAVEFAREQAMRQKADVRFEVGNALKEQLPEDYDIVICSLFLHHLKEDEAVHLLRAMGRSAQRLVLVNDLIRNPSGWLMVYLGTRLVTTSHVVHVDGPLSVEAAFTLAEARALAGKAGLNGVEVAPRWPCRFLLTWRRP